MQERYLGDCHDFLKYAILRQLHATFGGPVGLNWYLTRPETVDRVQTNDGEQRHHLRQPEWEHADAALLQGLRAFQAPEHRRLADFEASGILPADTRFVSTEVPGDAAERARWHGRARADLSGCRVIFLDPDNGFEVASMTRRSAPKYARFDEVRDYEATGAIVVTIQFARQCDPVRRAALIDARRGGGTLPVLRGRVAPNLLFFLGAPTQDHDRLVAALDALGARLRRGNGPGKLDWIARPEETA